MDDTPPKTRTDPAAIEDPNVVGSAKDGMRVADERVVRCSKFPANMMRDVAFSPLGVDPFLILCRVWVELLVHFCPTVNYY